MFRFAYSVLVSGFVGIYVGVVLLRVQGAITDIVFVIVLALLSGVFVITFSIFPLRDYHANLNKIDDLLNRVEKGEGLPSLSKLRKL